MTRAITFGLAWVLTAGLLSSFVWGEKPMTHPSVLVKKEDLPELRRKCQAEPFKSQYTGLLAACDRWLTGPPSGPEVDARNNGVAGFTVSAGRKFQGRALGLSLAWLLTDDRRYLERAKTEIFAVIDDPHDWVDPFHRPLICDLVTGEMSAAVGLAYDMLYDGLTDAERDRILAGLRRKGLQPYLTQLDRKGWWAQCTHNWNSVVNGGCFVGAVATRDRVPEAARILTDARANIQPFFRHWGADGGWDEGTGYWYYGTSYAMLYLVAAESAELPTDGWLDSEVMKQTGAFPTYFNPGGVTCNFGDSSSRAAGPLMYELGRRYGDGRLIEYADRWGLRPTREGGPDAVLTILWRPEEIPATRHPAGNLKVFSGIHWAAMFDRWPDPDIYLAYKSGDLGANHTHLDLNSFQLVAFGEKLIVDTGNPPYSHEYFSDARWKMYQVGSAGHNCVLVNGGGHLPRRRGTIGDARQEAGYAYLVGDASRAYDRGVERARRHVVFVRQRYFVLLDEVTTDEPAQVQLVFHTYSPVDAQTRLIRGERATLAVESASPVQLKFELLENPEKLNPAENVLRTSTVGPSSETAIATLLYPARKGEPVHRRFALVRKDDGALEATVEDAGSTDVIRFERTDDGWALKSVSSSGPKP